MEELPGSASTDGTIEVGDASLHCRRDGKGPAVVFLHGFPLSGYTWDKVVSLLRDRFTCYTPDLIGLGGSHSAAAHDHSSQGQARVIQQALRQLDVESYALVGNDTGGWIARELVLIDKPRVSRLLLTNTEIPFHRPPWIPMYQALAHVPGFGSILRQSLRAPVLRRSSLVFGGCFHDPMNMEGEFQRRFVEPLITSTARMRGALEFLRRMKFSRLDQFDRLHEELMLPTLLVWGADDPTFPVARAREMARRFPDLAGFHEVKNAKLFFYEEQPEELAGHIQRFLT